MNVTSRRVVVYGLTLCTPVILLGGYFLWLVYQPFSKRIVAPQTLVPEYDGPGSLKRERERHVPETPAP